jgi:MFS family permease
MTAAAAPLRRLLDRRFVLAVVGVWTLCRLVTTVILVQVAHHWQDPSVYDQPGVPRYFQLATLWDGAWYERIATEGYPEQLPLREDGQVRQNAWAFYPLFPALARALSAVTGWPFAVTGTVVATVLGYAAALVVAGLLRERVGRGAALGAVALLGTYPSAPTFQVAYTESLALLLLAAVLWLLVRRAWWSAAVVALLTGLARPVALPLGLVALVAVVLRWRSRGSEPLRRTELAGMAAALVGCGLAGLIWPALAWNGTGVPDAYTVTMSAWRGGEDVVAFQPTLERVQWLWGDLTGLLVLALGLGLLVLAVLGPWARGLGPELRTWCLGYTLYLFAALDPWTSIYRYLMLLFPLFVLMVGGGWARSERWQPTWLLVVRTLLLALVLVGWQVWWSWELFRFVPPRDDPP